MSKPSFGERAAALLALPIAQGAEDFARRAAACYLLAGCAVDGFDAYLVWPAAISEFTPGDAAENLQMAAAILAAARPRRSGGA